MKKLILSLSLLSLISFAFAATATSSNPYLGVNNHSHFWSLKINYTTKNNAQGSMTVPYGDVVGIPTFPDGQLVKINSMTVVNPTKHSALPFNEISGMNTCLGKQFGIVNISMIDSGNGVSLTCNIT